MTQNEFSEYIRNSGLDAKTIARTFDISIPSVKRWLTGVSMPHAVMIPIVIENIEKLKEAAKNENP